MENIKNFAEYCEAKKRMQKVMEKVTVPMLMFGKPAEIQQEIDEIEKAIYDFEHAYPFAVYVLPECGGTYEMIGRYATAEEAIKNRPEYDAHVTNTVTYEDVYWSERHPNRPTW